MFNISRRKSSIPLISFSLFLVLALLFSTFYPVGGFESDNLGFGSVSTTSNYGNSFSLSNYVDFHNLTLELPKYVSDKSEVSIPNSSYLILDVDGRFKGEVIKEIVDIGGRVRHIFEFHNQIAVYVPIYNLSKLSSIIGIRKVWKDRIFRACMNVSVPIVKPTSDWNAVESYFGEEINGTGVKIAVLDTGIDANHYDLYPRVILNASYVQFEGWNDENGHGTHVAGIIAGNGNRSAGKYTGLAPCAYIQNFKVLNKFAVGYESAVLEALEDAVTNSSDLINLSLATEDSGNGDDPYSQKIDWVVSQGIPVIVAAGGNEDQYYNISRPGVCQSAITVGSSDDFDNIYNSPFGPVLSPSFAMKPDLLAPGYQIISCRSSLAGGFGFPINTFYTQVSGTSMATAHVSGIIALIKQVRVSWTPEMIKNALMNTADDLGLNPFKQGCGRVFAPRAINSSLLVDGNLNFQLVGVGDNVTKKLTVQNLDNVGYNISISHNNLDYSFISQYNISALSSIEIPINLNPTVFTSHQNYDKLSFITNGSAQVHSMLTSITPTVSVNLPSQYENASVIGSYLIDDVIDYNYTGYRSDIFINGSFLDSHILNESGWFNHTPYLFRKSYYNVTTDLYDSDNNFLYSYNQMFFVDGLDTTFTVSIAPLVTGFATTGSVIFDDPTVSGIVVIKLLAEHRSGLVTCNIQNGYGSFLIFWGVLSENNPVEVWPITASYLGSDKHNPVEVSGSINVFPQLRPKPFEMPWYIWVIIIGLVALGVVFVMSYRSFASLVDDFRERVSGKDDTQRLIREIKDEIKYGREKSNNRELLDFYVSELVDEHMENGKITASISGPECSNFLRKVNASLGFEDLSLNSKIVFFNFLFSVLVRLGFNFNSNHKYLVSVLDLYDSDCVEYMEGLYEKGKYGKLIQFHERVKFFVVIEVVRYYEMLLNSYKVVKADWNWKMINRLLYFHNFNNDILDDSKVREFLELPADNFVKVIKSVLEKEGSLEDYWMYMNVIKLYIVSSSKEVRKLRRVRQEFGPKVDRLNERIDKLVDELGKQVDKMSVEYKLLRVSRSRLETLLLLRQFEVRKLKPGIDVILDTQKRKWLEKSIMIFGMKILDECIALIDKKIKTLKGGEEVASLAPLERLPLQGDVEKESQVSTNSRLIARESLKRFIVNRISNLGVIEVLEKLKEYILFDNLDFEKKLRCIMRLSLVFKKIDNGGSYIKQFGKVFMLNISEYYWYIDGLYNSTRDNFLNIEIYYKIIHFHKLFFSLVNFNDLAIMNQFRYYKMLITSYEKVGLSVPSDLTMKKNALRRQVSGSRALLGGKEKKKKLVSMSLNVPFDDFLKDLNNIYKKAIRDAGKTNHKLLMRIIQKLKKYDFRELSRDELLKVRDIAYNTYMGLGQRKKAGRVKSGFVKDRKL